MNWWNFILHIQQMNLKKKRRKSKMKTLIRAIYHNDRRYSPNRGIRMAKMQITTLHCILLVTQMSIPTEKSTYKKKKKRKLTTSTLSCINIRINECGNNTDDLLHTKEAKKNNNKCRWADSNEKKTKENKHTRYRPTQMWINNGKQV